MVLRRSIKALLVLVVVAVLIAIVSSFLARSRALLTPPENDLLPEDVQSRGTDFDHREFKLGKIVFRVRSQTDTVNAHGERQLREVELLVFGDDGEVQDAVTGQEATYWVEQKRIELRKDVKIRLADGTRIYSKSLEGDLEKEILEIRDGFTFERTEAGGSGSELTYRISDRHLSVRQTFQMKLAAASGLEIQSQAVEYDLSGGIMDLTGAAQIRGQAEVLSARRVLVSLNADSQVQKVEAMGAAEFTSPPHIFSGARIVIDFAGSGEGVTAFQVDSGKKLDLDSDLRAAYRQHSASGLHQVMADQFVLTPRPGATSTTEVLLESFRAVGDVILNSRSHFIQNSRSDSMTGQFEAQGAIERLELIGNVRLERTPPAVARQNLEAPRVICLFEKGRLSSVWAEGPLRLRLQDKDETRTLRAENSFRVAFRSGEPLNMSAQGQVQVDSAGPKLQSSLQTPALDASFAQGLLKQIEAGPGVRLTSQEGERSRVSTSRQLMAHFESGVLSRIQQSGDFVLIEGGGEGKTELKADEGRFSVVSQAVETGGSEGSLRQWDDPEEPPVVTTAARFLISSGNREVTAEGNVKSEFIDVEQNQPIRISAGRMQGSEVAEWVVYDREQPALQTETSNATGRRILLQKSTGLLRVEGDVDSRLRQVNENGEREYRIQAETLELDRAAGHALYTGSVQARSAEMLLKAPFVELFLASEASGTVERVRAWDGVEIIEPSRKATGDACFYLPAENVVRLNGSPAQVTDDRQGKAFGPLLVFYPGTDILIIESAREKTP